MPQLCRHPRGMCDMNVSSLLQNFSNDHRLTREEAACLVNGDSRESMLSADGARGDAAHGRQVSYWRKVFIRLTRLCRDVCHYCTFAHAPRAGEKPFLSIDQMIAIAGAGKK